MAKIEHKVLIGFGIFILFCIGFSLWGALHAHAAVSNSTTYLRNILPETTNKYELGTTSLQWKTIYTNNLNVSGTCTGCGGGGSQTPWAQDIDGGGFNLNNVYQVTLTTLASNDDITIIAPNNHISLTGVLYPFSGIDMSATTLNMNFGDIITAGDITSVGTINADGVISSLDEIDATTGFFTNGYFAASGQDSNNFIAMGTTSSSIGGGGNRLKIQGNAYFSGDLGLSNINATGTATTTNLNVSGSSKVGTVIQGTWNGSTIGCSYGGTGQTATNKGSLLYGDSNGCSWAVLAPGAGGTVLTEGGSGVAWSDTITLVSVGATNATLTNLLSTNATTTNFEILGAATTTNFYIKNAFIANGASSTISGSSTLSRLTTDTLQVGLDGHGIKKIYTGSATLDFASLISIGCEDLTVSVTGSALGDVVNLGTPNASVVANSSYSAWVSSAGTVTVRYCALIAGDPASGLFNIEVVRI